MTVEARVQFGMNVGVATLDDEAPAGFKVEWQGRTPLLWRKVINEVRSFEGLHEEPTFSADQVRITGARGNRMDILDAWSLGRYLNLVWLSARERDISFTAESDDFQITFRVPRLDPDEELTGVPR